MTDTLHGHTEAREHPAPVRPNAQALFAGPGEMRALCRAFDWGSTPLGPVEHWSPGLRAAVRIVLGSRNPMFLFWGPELVQFYNDAYRPSLGHDGRHPRALGARGSEFWTDVWAEIGPQIAQVMANGEATWHEDQYLPMLRNGRLDDAWWTYSYSPAYEDDGSVGGALVVLQETTTRVLAEREQERLLAALDIERIRLDEVFRRSPSFLAVLRGPDYVFELVNHAYQQFVGAGRELLGKPMFEALPETRGQGLDEYMLNVRETGKSLVFRELPVRVARTPGAPPEQRFVDITYLPLVEADGTHSALIAHGVDITEQVRARQAAEQLLLESERSRADAERARERTAVLMSLTEALSSASTGHEIAEAIVRKTTDVFGAEGAVLARLSADGEFLELVGATDMPSHVRDAWLRFPAHAPVPIADVARTLEPVFLESRADWQARYAHLLPLADEAGHHANIVLPLVTTNRTLGVLGVAFATSRVFDTEDREVALTLARLCAQALERARLFDAEHAARETAEGANRAKSEFLAVMSHELRTPLNAIDGYAELMELGIRGPLTEEQRHDLGRIRKSERHLLGLINGVLNYAQLEAGVVRYELEDVPLEDVLATCEAFIAPQIRSRGLTLLREPCPSGLQVRADREKTQQVLLNLLSNAMKFTDAGGRIALRCTPEHDGVSGVVHISVSDTGIGIAATQLAHVFEPFVQIDARLTRTREGTGLGLAISRDLARGMHGDLRAASVLGEGSVFTLTLPAA